MLMERKTEIQIFRELSIEIESYYFNKRVIHSIY